MADFKDLTLTQAAEMIAKKEISAMELATSALERVREIDTDLHAFLHVAEERALG
jgi:aspartyl-tRNA(Asn)/glutamyl-tRNA(Gln) amidotransferase subunit A